MKTTVLPFITIGVTCYNASNTIERAILSALNQEGVKVEIIVVDDCSIDDSVAKIKSIQGKHGGINLIEHEKNTGPAGARQTVLDYAKGDFIIFFDDDDESLPERLETQCNRIVSYEIETGESLVACYSSGYRLYDNGYKKKMQAIGSQPQIPFGPEVADYLLFYGKKKGSFYGSGTPTCALMARKSTFYAIGGFDPLFRRVEDADFAIRLALLGGHFIGCPEPMFVQHATNAVDKTPDRNLQAEILLAEKHREYLQSIDRYEYAREWPQIRYYHFNREYKRMISLFLTLFFRYPIKVGSHILQTGPRRLWHEIKMKRTKVQ